MLPFDLFIPFPFVLFIPFPFISFIPFPFVSSIPFPFVSFILPFHSVPCLFRVQAHKAAVTRPLTSRHGTFVSFISRREVTNAALRVLPFVLFIPFVSFR
jgi:hypothetical protein